MKKDLFGKNIRVNCAYCENSEIQNDILFCKKSKKIKNDKCRSFRYDPLMRVPDSFTFKSAVKAEDFKL